MKLGRKVASIGDINAVDYGGGTVFNLDGRNTLWYTHGAETEAVDPFDDDFDEDTAMMEVYRVDVPDSKAELLSWYDWVDWGDVSSTIGMDTAELLDVPDTVDGRAGLLEAIASYYGWHELDSYPESYSYGLLNEKL